MLVIFNGEHDVAAAAVAADGTCVEEISGKTTNSGLASRDGNSISRVMSTFCFLVCMGISIIINWGTATAAAAAHGCAVANCCFSASFSITYTNI